LLGVGRVVQHDPHPPIGHPTAAEAGLGVQISGDLVGIDPERVKESPHGLLLATSAHQSV
jgi:hypothetical protein